MTQSAKVRTIHVVFIVLGVIPTFILTLFMGSLGLWAGTLALMEGSYLAALFIPWVLVGIFGLIALCAASQRFNFDTFRLRRWEMIGITGGFIACLPFPFLGTHRGSFDPKLLIYDIPIALSALSGATLMAQSILNARHSVSYLAEEFKT